MEEELLSISRNELECLLLLVSIEGNASNIMPFCGRLYGPDGERYTPTLMAPRQVDIEEDCIALRQAMKGIGTDEGTIVDILGNRSMHQRLRIKEHYKACFGKDLIEETDNKLSSNFKDLVKTLLYDRATVNAKAMYKAMKGGGTNERTIAEILCTSSNREIEEMKEAYKNVLAEEGIHDTDRTLERDLERELTILDRSLVESDTREIYGAGEGRLGTDEDTIIRIITTRNIWHIKAVASLYEAKSGTPLLDAIHSETRGDFRDALKLLVSTCISPTQVFSELLRNAMAGAGTKDSTLIRIIVMHCESDLGNISKQFEKDQGEVLEKWIRKETSGNYRRLLLVLLGCNHHS
ncbi:unnamed protein product [Calicophoron daubneyi]|uniref:Annexin n=1 Tax=Calicophoron daubneyi TaxID=300641 RepID=A0AAV2T234_CALDB